MNNLLLFLALLATTPSLLAVAVVRNVRAAQIPGTHQLKITYDFTASSPCTVRVQAWLEVPRTNLDLPDAALSGDITADNGIKKISPGTGKSITFTIARTDASGTTWLVESLKNTFTKNLKFKVLATESSGPVTYGDMAHIPAGNFTMGDQSNPLVGYSDERPVHTVYVSEFYMAKYETTKELWDEVRVWGLNNGYTDLAVGNGSSASKGANHPVHSITWYDMVKWCNARSQKEGLTPCYSVSGATYKTGNSAPDCNFLANGYRLPTESEWEKGARGGQSGKNFPWGNEITHDDANYYSSTSYSYDKSLTRGYHPDYDESSPYTAPVNSFAPNGYGCYNMSGNVWECCWDWYEDNYYSVLAAGYNPLGSTSGLLRVRRGGSWANSASNCRVALRISDYFPPASSNNYIGFRLARSSGHRG